MSAISRRSALATAAASVGVLVCTPALPEERPGAQAKDSATPLPEFRVSLTRLKKGEAAYPINDDTPHYEYHGRRTKLGGVPDWQQGDESPVCARCKKKMIFVAQIDSVEHEWKSNPHSVSAFSKDQKWMFGDVGMIYVFFCFACLETESVFQCG